MVQVHTILSDFLIHNNNIIHPRVVMETHYFAFEVIISVVIMIIYDVCIMVVIARFRSVWSSAWDAWIRWRRSEQLRSWHRTDVPRRWGRPDVGDEPWSCW